MLTPRSIDELEEMPQYNRLLALHDSLKPLLPGGAGVVEAAAAALDLGNPALVTSQADFQADDLNQDLESRSKRGPLSFDFKGNRVSYPQYLRLKALQDKVSASHRLAFQILFNP